MNESELDQIMRWPIDDYGALITFIEPYFNQHGRLRYSEDGLVNIATGGWSGVEEVVSALRANHIFWATCWVSSHRGGLFVFRLPT